MDKKPTFEHNLGYWLGKLFCICLFTCLSAVIVALTIKFIGWVLF